jgi:iron uptake system component EfeO
MPSFALPSARRSVARTALAAVAVVVPLALAACGQSSQSPAAQTASARPSATADAERASLLSEGTGSYAAYVKDETDKLLAGTLAFAEAYAAGDAEKARSLYAPTRMHWERIEPVAEQFEDLDPKLDAREASLEPGQEWTGWHRAEKDLFPPAGYTPLAEPERRSLADQLVADTRELHERTRSVELTPEQLGDGAKELLDEVARGKVTGEEEAFSHTDLWDFQGNVDGAKKAFESLKPALVRTDPTLAADLDAKFAALQAGLSQHARGTGFVRYDELNKEQVQALAALVDALGEPLSRLTAAVSA